MIENALRIVAALATVAFAAGLAVWIPRLPGLKALAPTPPHGGRVGSLDGLRGILAVAVVLSHALSYRAFFATGRWKLPPVHAFALGGQWAVATFFAITAYLFWSRAAARPISPLEHYRGRFLRIYPLYAALVLVSVLIALVSSFPVHEGAGHLARVAARLVVPGVGIQSVVNGFSLERFITQTWTLLHETVFYAVLPLIAPLARRPASAYGLAGAMLTVAALVPPTGHALVDAFRVSTGLFAVGMLVATLRRQGAMQARLQGRLAAVASLAATLGIFLLPSAYVPLALPLLVVAFAPLAAGNDGFGLLTLAPLQSLGEITYSLYMVHNLVLYGAFRLVPVASLSETGFWGLVLASLVPLVTLALVAFRFLERPFMGRHPLPAADAAP